MSYQVLARKWRPKSFAELVGQQHVVSVLVNALNQQRLHHAYLFTGTRGVGKTTIARIFAKSLNCQQGISANPCGHCEACVDIDQGRYIDLLEIDAASRTKVDDTREILDNVQYAPSRGKYKVYLIDEVHMLSRSSFNALLKTLEEPPEHVKFILATTDPQKLPVTVLSRCLQFHLKALTREQIEHKLAEILQAEQVEFEQGVLSLLSKAARGSMRDCLSLTDQAIAQGQGQISLANLQQMLGGVDHHWPYKLLIQIVKNDTKALMQLVLEIASYAPSYQKLLADIIELLHQIALYQVTQQCFDLQPEHQKLVAKFAKAISAADVQLYYQIAVNGRKDLPYAADEQAAFDMVILRMLAFRPMQQDELTTQVQTTTATQNFDQVELAETAVASEQETVQLQAQQNAIESVEQQQHLQDEQNQLTAEMLAVEQQAYEQGYQTDEIVELPEQSNIEDSRLTESNQPEDEPAIENVPDFQQSINTEQAYSDWQQNHETNNASAQTIEQPAQQVAAHNTADSANASPAIQQVLQTRNQLRSRKKQVQEQAGKKSNGAVLRQSSAAEDNNELEQQEKQQAEQLKAQALEQKRLENEALANAGYDITQINPTEHKFANQVDRWAHMIDAMQLSGRLRQLAIHSTIEQKSDQQTLCLKLDKMNQHLLNHNAQNQLQQAIREFMQQNIKVEIEVVAQTTADPYAIQADINAKRLEYAEQRLMEDEIVQQLLQRFDATLDKQSIKAL